MGDHGVFSQDDEFWNAYVKGRPKVPASFFNRLYDYHAVHGGSFDVAHDLGAGVGHFSIELGKRFNKVIVSDPATTTIDKARARLAKQPDGQKYEIHEAKAEDDILPPASVDLVFSCNALHWTDVASSMKMITKQLKPGGTFFAALFGLPHFENADVEKIWYGMFEKGIREVQRRLGADFQTTATTQDSGYDVVPLPERDYEAGALRLKLNTRGNEHAFHMAPEATKPTTDGNRIGPDDKVIFEEDEQWNFEKDLQGLKDTFYTFPISANQRMFDAEWLELEQALGSMTVKGYWPASITLATRKK